MPRIIFATRGERKPEEAGSVGCAARCQAACLPQRPGSPSSFPPRTLPATLCSLGGSAWFSTRAVTVGWLGAAKPRRVGNSAATARRCRWEAAAWGAGHGVRGRGALAADAQIGGASLGSLGWAAAGHLARRPHCTRRPAERCGASSPSSDFPPPPYAAVVRRLFPRGAERCGRLARSAGTAPRASVAHLLGVLARHLYLREYARKS